jgi:hypothetical protein
MAASDVGPPWSDERESWEAIHIPATAAMRSTPKRIRRGVSRSRRAKGEEATPPMMADRAVHTRSGHERRGQAALCHQFLTVTV